MNMRSLASLYEGALSEAPPESVEEQAESVPLTLRLPDERTLQLLLLEGRLGFQFTDDLGRNILIQDCGEWNKSAGPDFLNARVCIDNELLTGDIELDPSPEDWERHGHGANAAFNGVILHLTCIPSRREWFTRNARHERIAKAVIPPALLASALSTPPPAAPPDRNCPHMEELASLKTSQLNTLLQAAAAYRFQRKHQGHATRLAFTTPAQALYENLAETLGYHANKTAMRHLALRVPLHSIRESAEALLFGAAGFLVPVLPESCTPEAIAHHKNLWSQWWPRREQFELNPSRQFPWTLSGSRPANHPQRRIGALAAVAADFATFHELCTIDRLKQVADYLTTLTHHYWSHHVTLPSKPSKRPMALIGKDRIKEFIINHLLPTDGSDRAWGLYLSIKAAQPASAILTIHQRLLGCREDRATWLQYAWQHQALLQIHEDLCFRHSCSLCSLLKQTGAV